MRATGVLLAGTVVVVAGYGWCGSGIAARARGLGAQVVVTEVEPRRALEAVLDGHRVLPMTQAAALGDVFLTSTGNRDVLTPAHFAVMKDGAVLANAGHFDVEIAIADLGDEEAVGTPFRWGGTELRSGTLSPDGRLLAALGANGNLRLWDVASHTVLGPGLRAFPRGDSSRLVFTGDDELVAWDGVGAALRWRVDVDAWAETACDLAGRQVTEDEWEQYLPGEPYDPACDGRSA
jgi:hypothetical protein